MQASAVYMTVTHAISAVKEGWSLIPYFTYHYNSLNCMNGNEYNNIVDYLYNVTQVIMHALS